MIPEVTAFSWWMLIPPAPYWIALQWLSTAFL